MSVLATNNRVIYGQFTRLSATTATTISDGKQNGRLIENVLIVNTGSATTITVTLDLYDVANSVAYVIRQAFPLAAAGQATGTDTLQINQQIWLRGNWLLRATRTNGSANDVHCHVLEGQPPSGQDR